MAKGNKKEASKKGNIKDAIKLTLEPPPKAITPPEKTEKKANRKK
jgi:hypothetical protein